MAYVRTRWVSRTTPLSAENMNNIEDGIAEAKAHANGNATMWSYIMEKISSVLGLTASQYGGNAATATSATSAGNSTTVNGHTVNADVPSNAKFTDTTYSAVTTSANGLMTASDKTKLNSIATGAEVNQNAFGNVKVGSTTVAADAKTDTLELVAGNNVTLTADATNDKVTVAAKDTTYSAATTSAAGLMSASDKSKLNGIASGATQNTTASLIDLIYPVGSIYMSVNSTNPGTRFGRGTWVAWGAGKVPVGIDSSDSSFNAVEKSGGSKDAVLPSHRHTFTGNQMSGHAHTVPSHSHSVNDGNSRFLTVATDPDNPVTRDMVVTLAQGTLAHSEVALFSENPVVRYTNTSAAGACDTSAVSAGTPSGTISLTGESATNANLQPYITCYMWKRTA